MKIIVIGASSYLGARIYKNLELEYETKGTFNSNQIFPSLFQLDITSQKSVQSMFEEARPDIVIHTANFNSPRNIDEERFLAVNRDGNNNIVDHCNKIGAKLVFISSLAAETALNIYGTVKSETENLVKKNNNKYLIIRPSAIFGLSPNIHSDNLSNKLIKTIKGAGNFEYDSSWILQPTYIAHIPQIIRQVINNNLWNKTLRVFTNTPVTQYHIAGDVLDKFGLKATPLHTNRVVPLSPENQEELEVFDLKPRLYNDLINDFVREIKTII